MEILCHDSGVATATLVRIDSFFKDKGETQLVEVVANDRFISARDVVTGKYLTITEQQLVVGDWVSVEPAAYKPEDITRLADLGISL